VRTAAERLKIMAGDLSAAEQARLASRALRRLYLEHLSDVSKR
jgi:hypothetical protein